MSLTHFKISGVDAKGVDATSNFTTDSYRFEISQDWSVSFKDNAVVGLPTYTLEVSNNNATWYDLNVLSTNVKLEDSITSDFISYRYMRVVYTANAASAGTVDVELSTKNKTNARG